MRHLFALASLSFAVTAANAFPKLPAPPAAKPLPAGFTDYKGVDQAITVKIETPNAGATGATGYLGLTVAPDASGRIVVEAVQPDSPAQRAGIVHGDVIIQIAGRPIATLESVREWIQAGTPGKPIKLIVLRDGKSVEVAAILKETSRPLRVPTGPRPYLGIELEDSGAGDVVKVRAVAANSPAAKAMIEPGDQLLKFDGEEITRPSKLNEVLGYRRPGDMLTLVVLSAKDKKEKELSVTLATPEPSKGGPGSGFGGRGGGRPGGGNLAVPPSLWKSPTLKLAIIGIDFADTKHNAKVTPEELEKLFLSRGSYKQNATGQSVTGSLNDYLHEVSAGRLKLDGGKVFPWVEVAKKRGDYVQGTGTSNRSAPLVDALAKLVAGDNKDALKDFDAIVFVYAGSRFAQNRGAVFAPHAGTIQHQTRRLPYMLIPEGGATVTNLGGIAKEAGLMLGLPDLTVRRENIGAEGLGPWCAMSAPDIDRPARPPHFSPWCKEKLGWIDPKPIDPTMPQKLILAPIEQSSKECFKVLVRPDGSEYLLLENRRKNGFDADLPGEGLLVWRVVNDRPILQESHGVEGPTGPTIHLSAVPYPSAANNAFTPTTIPSSRSPQGGGLPVFITDIKRHADGRISFRIGYEYD